MDLVEPCGKRIASDHALMVYTCGGHLLETVHCPPTAKIADVKLCIRNRRNIPQYRQRLVIGDDIPGNNVTLESLKWPCNVSFLELQWSYDAKDRRELSDATKNGDAARVDELLSVPVDPNHAAEDSFAPLLLAADYGHESIVHLLCEASADINKRSAWGRRSRVGHTYEMSPLGIAAMNGNARMVQCLLDLGADKDQESQIYLCRSMDMTPLCLAACHGKLEVAQLLCDIGADKDRVCSGQCSFTFTALSLAVHHKKLDMVKLLCKARARIDIPMGSQSLIFKALYKRSYDMADTLCAAGAQLSFLQVCQLLFDMFVFKSGAPLRDVACETCLLVLWSLGNEQAALAKALFAMVVICISLFAFVMHVLAFRDDDHHDPNMREAAYSILAAVLLYTLGNLLAVWAFDDASASLDDASASLDYGDLLIVYGVHGLVAVLLSVVPIVLCVASFSVNSDTHWTLDNRVTLVVAEIASLFVALTLAVKSAPWIHDWVETSSLLFNWLLLLYFVCVLVAKTAHPAKKIVSSGRIYINLCNPRTSAPDMNYTLMA